MCLLLPWLSGKSPIHCELVHLGQRWHLLYKSPIPKFSKLSTPQWEKLISFQDCWIRGPSIGWCVCRGWWGRRETSVEVVWTSWLSGALDWSSFSFWIAGLCVPYHSSLSFFLSPHKETNIQPVNLHHLNFFTSFQQWMSELIVAGLGKWAQSLWWGNSYKTVWKGMSWERSTRYCRSTWKGHQTGLRNQEMYLRESHFYSKSGEGK